METMPCFYTTDEMYPVYSVSDKASPGLGGPLDLPVEVVQRYEAAEHEFYEARDALRAAINEAHAKSEGKR